MNELNKESKRGKVYIYNQRQMNYYITRGLVPICIGQGVHGDTFAVFKYEEHQALFDDWINIKDEFMLNLIQ